MSFGSGIAINLNWAKKGNQKITHGFIRGCATPKVSTPNKFFRHIFCLSILITSFCYADQQKYFIVNSYKRPAKVSYKGKDLLLDEKLAKEWQVLNQGFAISSPFFIDGYQLVWFVIKIPSKPNSLGRGLCGTGTEDYFYLTKLNKNKLFYTDKFLARGCLAFAEVGDGAELSPNLEGILVDKQTLIFEQKKTEIETEKRTYRQVTLSPTKNKIQVDIKLLSNY